MTNQSRQQINSTHKSNGQPTIIISKLTHISIQHTVHKAIKTTPTTLRSTIRTNNQNKTLNKTKQVLNLVIHVISCVLLFFVENFFAKNASWSDLRNNMVG